MRSTIHTAEMGPGAEMLIGWIACNHELGEETNGARVRM